MSESLYIACPACGAKNRLPADRLEQHPNCGRCSKPLFTAHPATLTDSNFAAIVEGTDVPIVVDCWASWCGPCQMFAPVFEQAAQTLEPRYRLVKLDTEANPQTAARLGIRSIPTLITFKGGKEQKRISGALPLNQFLQWVQQGAAG